MLTALVAITASFYLLALVLLYVESQRMRFWREETIDIIEQVLYEIQEEDSDQLRLF